MRCNRSEKVLPKLQLLGGQESVLSYWGKRYFINKTLCFSISEKHWNGQKNYQKNKKNWDELK